MARKGPTPPGGDDGGEANPVGHGSGTRGGSSQSWGTGGLTFDTKGIKEFTSAMGEAAKAVDKFWAPFKDTKTAETKTKAFFDHLKKQIQDLKKEQAGLVPVDGGTGAGDHRHGGGGGNGGDSKVSNPVAGGNKRRKGANWQGAFGAGRDAYGEARDPNGGPQKFGGSVWQGVKAGHGALEWAAIGVGAVHMAERYADKNVGPAMAVQSTANQAILQQGTKSWSADYRDKMTATLAQEGLKSSMRGGFQGREDVASAAQVLMGAGLAVSTATPGKGRGQSLSPEMKQGAAVALLTGRSGAEGTGLVAGMRGPQTVNAARMLGIQVQPGGKLKNQYQIFKQVRDYIFSPLGRPPTKDEINQTLLTPGTQSYVLIRQIFGDEAQVDAFVKWCLASAPAKPGGKGADITDIASQSAAGVDRTSEGKGRRGEAAREKRKAEGDKALLGGYEGATSAVTSFNNALTQVIENAGGAADAVFGLTGGVGTLAKSIPGLHGALGGLLNMVMEGAVLRRMMGGGGGGGGGLPGGGGGMGSGLGAMGIGAIQGATGGLGTGSGIAALGGAALLGGAMAYGGNKLGQAISGIGRNKETGKANAVAKDAGTLTKYTALGAGIGTAIPIPGVGTLAGAAGGAIAGLGHIGLRHLGILGDPVGTWGWRPAPGGDVGDPADAAASMGATSGLRGPGVVQGMNSDFVQRLAKMFSDNPKLSLNSGFRDSAQQQKLYDLYKAGKGNLAAKPGSSKHEKGLAADVGPASEYKWISENAAKYGIGIPMPDVEPWHLQPSGGVSGAALAASTTPEDAGVSSGGGMSVGSLTGGSAGIPLGQGTAIPLSGGGKMAAHSAGNKAKARSAAASTDDSAKGGAAATGGMAGNPSQQEVMAAILKVGRSMGADEQTLLAAFETGWAESHMTNIHGGDRDSQGVFQQRPSQGWGSVEEVTDVEHAAQSFFKRAMGSKYKAGKGTAAQQAQDVQRSAFPTGSNYQAQRNQAVSSLSALGIDASGIGDPAAGVTNTQMVVVGGGRQGGQAPIVIHNLTIPVQIARGTPEEAESAARQIGAILTNRDRLMQIAGK